MRDMKRIDPNGAERRRGYVWPFSCDGKTEAECNALGCGITPDWMEEKEMGYKERQAEWLKGNNLRKWFEGLRVPEAGGTTRMGGDIWINSLMDNMVGKVEHHGNWPLFLEGQGRGHELLYALHRPAPCGSHEFEVGSQIQVRGQWWGTGVYEYRH